MKHVVILGAGFAGLELAGRLSDAAADEVRVTLVDQNDSFTFGFSKLDILFGHADAAAVRLPYREIVKPGVRFLQQTVTAAGHYQASSSGALTITNTTDQRLTGFASFWTANSACSGVSMPLKMTPIRPTSSACLAIHCACSRP